MGLVLPGEGGGGEEQQQQGGGEGQGDQEGGAKGCPMGTGWKHFGRLCCGQEEDMPLGQLRGGGQRDQPRHHELGELHRAGHGQAGGQRNHVFIFLLWWSEPIINVIMFS